MAIEVTLRLPENLVENAERFAKATQRDVDQVLADALEMMWETTAVVSESESSVSTLSDDAVLALAAGELSSSDLGCRKV